MRLSGVVQGVSVAREKKALKNRVWGQVESSETVTVGRSSWRRREQTRQVWYFRGQIKTVFQGRETDE